MGLPAYAPEFQAPAERLYYFHPFRIAVAILRGRRVGLLAQRQQTADVQVGGEIEMRNGLLGLHQPGRDGAPHGVERHLLERAVAVERHDLLGGGTGDAC